MAFATEREQASMVVVVEGLGSDQQVGRGAKQVACIAPLNREVFEAKERTAGLGDDRTTVDVERARRQRHPSPDPALQVEESHLKIDGGSQFGLLLAQPAQFGDLARLGCTPGTMGKAGGHVEILNPERTGGEPLSGEGAHALGAG